MKIKNIKCIFSILIIIFALTSCDKNELNNFETIKVKNGYSVENGYIKFENINEYKALYEKLSNASKLELEIWNKNLPFKSLELKYNEDNIQMYVADNNLTNEMGEQLNTKRLNPTLASLFNENGVLVINDTILKVKNEFLYSITNGDFSLLNRIENDINFVSKYVSKKLHTIKLEATKEVNSDGMQKNISDRTSVFYTSSKTREAVNFDAYVSGGYINFEMNGRYQKKGLLGWISSSSSPMVSGKINATGIHGSNNVNTNNAYLYNIEYVYLYFYVGDFNVTFNLDVTYTYKKTNATAYLHDWQSSSPTTTAGTFTRNYYWQQF